MGLKNIRLRITILCFFLAGSLSAHGQEFITGIVVDSATFSALSSVNVQIKNGTHGTVSDSKGNFTIQAERTDTLIFSLVGYETALLPLEGYEEGIIRLAEKYTLLEAVTIDEFRAGDLYEGMFEQQNARRKQSIPFYFSKARKEKIRLQGLRAENLLVQTYVDVVVNNPDLKQRLMQKHALSEAEYYAILTAFNERHHRVMYHLTRAELISLIMTFFEGEAAAR